MYGWESYCHFSKMPCFHPVHQCCYETRRWKEPLLRVPEMLWSSGFGILKKIRGEIEIKIMRGRWDTKNNPRGYGIARNFWSGLRDWRTLLGTLYGVRGLQLVLVSVPKKPWEASVPVKCLSRLLTWLVPACECKSQCNLNKILICFTFLNQEGRFL